MSKRGLLTLVGLCGLLAAPAEAGLPKVPKGTIAVPFIANPARTLERAEAMAARVGLAPPEAKPGWLTAHPALADVKGDLDLTRPIYAAVSKPNLDGPWEPTDGLVLYLPVAKKANVEKLVAKLSGPDSKLASRRDGGYLIISDVKRNITRKVLRRAIPKKALSEVGELDLAVLLDTRALDDKTVQGLIDEQGPARSSKDRVLKTLFEVFVDLARKSAPKGEMSVLGAVFAQDGLRITSRGRFVPSSPVGKWLAALPNQTKPWVVGYPEGPMMGSLGMGWNGPATTALVDDAFARTKKRLSKQRNKRHRKKDLANLAELATLWAPVAKALTGHTSLSFVVRPGGAGPEPKVTAIVPTLPDELVKQVPDFEPGAADDKAKVPAHLKMELDQTTMAYLVPLGARTLVTVGFGRLDLPALIEAAKASADPAKGVARYATARAALPKAVLLEAYLDPGPLSAIAMQHPDAAPFRPLANLVGSLPPVAIGVSVDGDEARTDIFVADGLLGLIGMAANLAMADGAQR